MKTTRLVHIIAEQFQQFPQVKAIALGGSQTSGTLDQNSDIDLYIYTPQEIPVEKRQQIVNHMGASKVNLNLSFWDPGDEWFDLQTGIEIDVMYWHPTWIEEQLDRVLVKHQASMGYTTCFWRTIKNSRILYDPQGWFSELQQKSHQPYPPQLKRAIIAKNHPLLRNVIPSYNNQVKKALSRNDLVSVNHRLTAFLASYFDVLFAINEVLHPGEKKILRFVNEECSMIPDNLGKQIAAILKSAGMGDRSILKELDTLIDGLDEILSAQGFDPSQTLSAAQ
jgi:hypothetical protein